MLKLLSKSIREYKVPSILAAVTMILEIVLRVSVPVFLAKLIDNGVEKGDMAYILKMGGFVVVLSLMSLTFGGLSGKFAAQSAAGFSKNLRHDIYSRIQAFSFSNIDRFSTPGLITRLTTDITNLQNAYQMIVRNMVHVPVLFVASFGMAFFVNARLAMVFLFTTPILGVGLFLIIKFAHPIFVRVYDKYDALNTSVQENLRGMRVVKSFVREDFETEKFHSRSKDIYEDFVKAEKILAFNSPLMQFAIYAVMLMFSWFGAKMIVSGTLSVGELMSMFNFAMQILTALMLGTMVTVIIIISYASAKRVTEVISEEIVLKNSENPVKTVKSGDISFKNVSFSYGNKKDKLCLKNLNFEIKSGETVGIVGGTGSGKSSLVHLIPRLYDVTEGVLEVGGINVREYDLETLRNSVAVVLQKNVLFSGTIKDNLRWGNPEATDEEMERICRLAQAHDFIMDFKAGYDTYIEQGGSNVSGGQKQRLCIARALLKAPKILILDDSTSAVDTKTDALIRKAFREEIPETTKLIIAQRIASIEDCDKILVMDEGRVVAVGTHEALVESSDIYREVFESQTKGGGEN